MKPLISEGLRNMLRNPETWTRVRSLKWAELQAALEHPHLSPEVRDGVIGDLEAAGALELMRQHPETTLGDAVEQLVSDRN